MSIFIITNSYTATADAILRQLSEANSSFFRLNVDFLELYSIKINKDGFQISDPLGRNIDSKDISNAFIYKGTLILGEYKAEVGEDSLWLASTFNNIINNIIALLMSQRKLKLFTPYEHIYPKTMQMIIAQKYWIVPTWSIDYGHSLPKGEVMVKQLTSRAYNGMRLDVKKVEASDLDTQYPWFTQKPAQGNRDATVLYINGKIHCYQFATERGELSDWRVTQGTEANQWEPWNAGVEFESKVRSYMQDMGLKFGRLDFIIGGEESEFLEVNPCGQFGWLDDEKLTLHQEVLEAILDPSSTIEL